MCLQTNDLISLNLKFICKTGTAILTSQLGLVRYTNLAWRLLTFNNTAYDSSYYSALDRQDNDGQKLRK